MADNDTVEVPFGDNPRDTAILLLAAARDLGEDTSLVETTGARSFRLPKRIHDAYEKANAEAAKAEPEPVKQPEDPQPPAKKATAKRAAKKSTAKPAPQE